MTGNIPWHLLCPTRIRNGKTPTKNVTSTLTDSLAASTIKQIEYQRQMVAVTSLIDRSEKSAPKFYSAMNRIGFGEKRRSKNTATAGSSMQGKGRRHQIAANNHLVELVPTPLVLVSTANAVRRSETVRKYIKRHGIRNLSIIKRTGGKSPGNASVGTLIIKVAHQQKKRDGTSQNRDCRLSYG